MVNFSAWYYVGTIILVSIGMIVGSIITSYKMAVKNSKEYTDQKVNGIKELHSSKIEDLKKDIEELKGEIRELRIENKEQSNNIIRLLTLVAQNGSKNK